MRKVLYAAITLLLLTLCICSAGAIADNRPYVDGGVYTDPYYFYNTTVRVVNGVVYTLYDGEQPHYEVIDFFATQELAKTVKTIRVAAEIDGVPVTAIRRGIANEDEVRENYDRPTVYRFEESYPQVQAIELPKSVTTLGIGALRGLDGIEVLKLPESVTTLEEGALSGMQNLRTLVLPKTITTLPRDLCRNDPMLSKVVFKGNLARIGMFAFQNCVRLTKIQLPDTPLTIDCKAFEHSGLTILRIPAKTNLICGTDEEKPAHFANCSDLKKVVFENRMKAEKALYLSPYLFANCRALQKVTLPANSRSVVVQRSVFQNCTALKTIKHMDRVTRLEKNALKSCRTLASFTLSKKIDQIHKTAFSGCTGLEKLRVLATSPAFLKSGAAFLQDLPSSCKVYVKTAAMKRAVVNAGCPGKVIVKADLK